MFYRKELLGWILIFAVLIEWCVIVLALIVLPEYRDAGRTIVGQLQNPSLVPFAGHDKHQVGFATGGTPLQQQRPRSPRSPRHFGVSFGSSNSSPAFLVK